MSVRRDGVAFLGDCACMSISSCTKDGWLGGVMGDVGVGWVGEGVGGVLGLDTAVVVVQRLWSGWAWSLSGSGECVMSRPGGWFGVWIHEVDLLFFRIIVG